MGIGGGVGEVGDVSSTVGWWEGNGGFADGGAAGREWCVVLMLGRGLWG